MNFVLPKLLDEYTFHAFKKESRIFQFICLIADNLIILHASLFFRKTRYAWFIVLNIIHPCILIEHFKGIVRPNNEKSVINPHVVTNP